MRSVTLAGIFAAALLAGCDDPPPAPAASAAPTVTIRGHSWRVEVAATAERRYMGLAGRRRLADNAGMLFVFPEPERLEFCMRGCLIDLDIAFIDAVGTVVSVHTMKAEPLRRGRKIYASSAPARYALEVAAGSLTARGVRPGDPVRFSPGIPFSAKAPPGR